MRLLLDTHMAYWLGLDRGKLTSGERAVLAAADGPLAFSAVSIWELRLKWHRLPMSGARKGPASPEAVLAVLKSVDYEELLLTGEEAASELHTPVAHKDPFDEILLAQAQVRGLRLLTRDSKLAGHPLAVTG